MSENQTRTDDEYAVERELLTRYEREREQARRQAQEAAERAERYELAIRGLLAVIPGAGDPDVSAIAAADPPAVAREARRARSGPRGEEAVRRVLEEEVGKPWSVADLTEELRRRGWGPERSKNPPSAVRAAANRLREKYPDKYVFEDGAFFARAQSVTDADGGSPDLAPTSEDDL